MEQPIACLLIRCSHLNEVTKSRNGILGEFNHFYGDVGHSNAGYTAQVPLKISNFF